MITTLIIDDDKEKVSRVVSVVTKVPGMSANEIDICHDLISARDRLFSKQYDLLILDLRLPNRHGDEPENFAGCDLVREITLSTTLLKPFHVIGLTAYDDVLERADPVFLEELWRVIKYDIGTADWERQLTRKVSYLVTSKQELSHSRAARHLVDLALVTALRKPELQAVLDLPGNWEEFRAPNDSTIYHTGTFKADGKALKVVAASAHQMGMPAAAVLSMKIISRFRPRLIGMSGVAAGVRGNAKIGDVVVADQCWDYGSGKRKIVDGKSVLLPDPRSIPLSLDLKERFQHVQADGRLVSKIIARWLGPRPESHAIVIGPIASGSSVVQDPAVVEEVRTQSRKLVAIEMESYGLFYAAENCAKPRPQAFVVKAVSDYADEMKGDDWQEFASFISANLIYEFALGEFGSLTSDPPS